MCVLGTYSNLWETRKQNNNQQRRQRRKNADKLKSNTDGERKQEAQVCQVDQGERRDYFRRRPNLRNMWLLSCRLIVSQADGSCR